MADDERASSPPAASSASTAPISSDAGAKSAPDVALLGGPTESGGIHILRMREGQVELGELRSLEDGKPILGESVRLHAREDRPGLFNVETLARGPLARRPQQQTPAPQQKSAPVLESARKGPAKVATEAYRSGWESIFQGLGSKRSGGDLPN